MSKKIGIILGTRPEIIKTSPIIRFCEENSINYYILHTNQHYSENMDKIFFDELKLSQPRYNLKIGSGNHGDMTGRMMIKMEKVFIKEKPDIILVQGDTNTAMAGALTASKMDIKVGHVEAGLRSYDRTMPEEINRVVADHISDFLFVPTKKQEKILKKEGINYSKIFVTGNTIVDAVHECMEIAEKKSKILKEIGIEKDNYILITSHRPATVDSKKNLNIVLKTIDKLARKYNKKIIFPIHPRTKKMIETFKIKLSDNYIIIDPIGYLDMLILQKNSFLIVTDSGGLQEESCILKKKCAVIRENTERPEAVEVGGCVLVGNSSGEKISRKINKLIKKKVSWRNPFGDGKTGRRIIEIINSSM